MKDKELRIRDGVVGAAILGSVMLGFKVSPVWFWLTGVIGILLIASAVFGVCLLYQFLNGGQCGLKKE
ncbi:MAG: DUF2892 domain-containing protein [Candidatus Omnitrophica bacterium]|nr:DUF2892 domain-containing protein [Candidatus Omnitrophota bacterium]